MEFKAWCRKVQGRENGSILTIQSDNGSEFKNEGFEEFCNEERIVHNFSSPRTPEQNRVVERKNRTLVEMARTMLSKNGLPRYFWAEAVNTSCYIINRAMVRPLSRKTPYELFKGKRPSITHFKVFGTKCFVHMNDKRDIDKFEAKSEPEIFFGYSATSRTYRI